jgi:hypothetical protein
MNAPELRIESWTSASSDDVRSGLLGYLSIRYGPLLLDGITLRRTADGHLALSFPARTDRAGRRHAYIRPVDAAGRAQIEAAVLAQVGNEDAER